MKTLDDYLALPDDVRVELIDGVFYDIPSHLLVHQRVNGIMLSRILNYIDINGGQCVPITAPTDVQLDCDDKIAFMLEYGRKKKTSIITNNM